MTATVVPTITPAQFAARVASMFPRNWASDDAKATGLVAGLMQAICTSISTALGQVQYAQGATLMGTATAPELDNASVDFFGGALPRIPGQLDASFAAMIEAALLKSAATRPAIIAAVVKATGATPRIIEPWNSGDTGCWDTACYFDVDTPANPARWADPSQKFQAFIESIRPPFVGTGNALQTFDDSAFWNVPGYMFSDASYASALSLYAIVNVLRAAGITLWLRITN